MCIIKWIVHLLKTFKPFFRKYIIVSLSTMPKTVLSDLCDTLRPNCPELSQQKCKEQNQDGMRD